MGADSRSSFDRPEGHLRGLSGQAEGRWRLFDGRHRPVGVFAVLYAVGFVSFLSALACGRAQDLELPYAVWHGENPDGQSHPFDARSRASLAFAGLFRSGRRSVGRPRRHESVPTPRPAHADRTRRNRVFLLAKARLPTLPDAQTL